MKNVSSLKEIYLNRYEKDGISKENIDYIENKLNVTLPEDFKLIAEFWNGGDLNDLENYDFYNERDDYNIVSETLILRKTINLPDNFIVLSEPPESLIVMDLKCKPSVIWIDDYDAENLADRESLNNPTLWNDYSDFFYAMLNDEI